MKEKVYLRCTKCNTVFLETVGTNESIYKISCPSCLKQSVELDLGHRFKETGNGSGSEKEEKQKWLEAK
jgi:Zn finger protein HypA/HybF involved in hydrogenase expression